MQVPKSKLRQTTLSFTKPPSSAMILTDEQRDIIEAPVFENTIVRASAGSSKTFTITRRIAHMLNYMGCQPKELFVTTFAREAAKNMRIQIDKALSLQVGDGDEKNQVNSDEILCGTFNSLAYRVMADYRVLENAFNCQVDEILVHFRDFLRSDSDDSKQFRSRINHIVVDEFQDINLLQFEIISELQRSAKSITVVGDEKQNIYAFRGSNVEFFNTFSKTFAPVTERTLSVNFRSTQQVVDFANSISRRSPDTKHVDAKAHNGRKGPKPLIVASFGNFQAIPAVIHEVMKSLSERPTSRICVLGRSHGLLQQIDASLCDRGVPTSYCASSDSASNSSGRVTISTIHSAKGLEWDHVIGVGFHGEFFPDSRETHFYRERNLLYVLATRAQTRLTLYVDSGSPGNLILELADDLDRIADVNRLELAMIRGKARGLASMDETSDLVGAKKRLDSQLSTSISKAMRAMRGQDYIELKAELIGELHNKMVSASNTVFRAFSSTASLVPEFVGRLGMESEMDTFSVLVVKLVTAHWLGQNPVYKEASSLLFDQYSRIRFVKMEVVDRLQSSYQRFVDGSSHWTNLDPRVIWDMALVPSIATGKVSVLSEINTITDEDADQLLPLITSLNSETLYLLNSHGSLVNQKPGQAKAAQPKEITIDVDMEWSPTSKQSLELTKRGVSGLRTLDQLEKMEQELKWIPAFLTGHTNFLIGTLVLDIAASANQTMSHVVGVQDNNNCCQVEHLLHVLMQASLLRLSGKTVTHIGLLDVRNQRRSVIDISEWNMERELCESVLKRVNDKRII